LTKPSGGGIILVVLILGLIIINFKIMDFEKPSTSQGETPEQIKARLAQEGKKMLTAEEYLEELKKKKSEEIPSEEVPEGIKGVYSGENIIKSIRAQKDKEGEAKDKFVKVGGFEESDRLGFGKPKKFEEMTPGEKEEYYGKMGFRPSVRV
jgi:hypothetical protein